MSVQETRRRDIPEDKYTNVFLGYGPEEKQFAVELTYNYGVTSYDIGAGFGHFGIATTDVYAMVDKIKAAGGKVRASAHTSRPTSQWPRGGQGATPAATSHQRPQPRCPL